MLGTLALLLAGLASSGDPAPAHVVAEVRAIYDRFDRLLSAGDAGFLDNVSPRFVYVGPGGGTISYADWTAGFRRATQRNRGARARTTVLEARVKGSDVVVHYEWRYQFTRMNGRRREILIDKSSCEDVWRRERGRLRLIRSRDFRIFRTVNGVPDGPDGPPI